MMMSEHLIQLRDAIEALGYDRKTAGKYASRIGDCVGYDEDGKVVVMEGGQVIARLDLRAFFDPPQ